MPCHVPTCPTRPGPSGFCALHQNRLNARASAYAEYMTDADRVAIAAHPGWRGRPFAVYPFQTAAGSVRFSVLNVKAYRRMHAQVFSVYDRAAEALAELDRKNGVAPAVDVARLGTEVGGLTLAVAVARAERDTARAYADAIRTHRDGLEERRRELAADNDVLANEVHLLRFANGHMRNSVETYRKRLEVYSDALDRQATDIARLTSELAERERDVTDLCAERDAYAADLEVARRTALADADTIDNLRTGVGHLETALTLARRPWWRKVWAWVTGGAS